MHTMNVISHLIAASAASYLLLTFARRIYWDAERADETRTWLAGVFTELAYRLQPTIEDED